MDIETLYSDASAHLYLDRCIRDRHHEHILNSMLSYFSLREGDTIVEIGAGSGRYTELLLSRGFNVKVYEPDPHLNAKLRRKLENFKGIEVFECGLEGLLESETKADLVCGFHVLHHLNIKYLSILAKTISSIRQKSLKFKGWFFLEPNPLNILYPISILLTKDMKFREEKGLWRLSYDILRTKEGEVSEHIGNIGLFPPRYLVTKFPGKVAKLGTKIRKRHNPFSLYSIIGELG